MKKILTILGIGIVLGIIFMIILNRFYPLGNIFRSSGDNEVNHTADNSFYEVTAKLDKGSDYYSYINAERINKLIRNSLSGVQEILTASPTSDTKKENDFRKPVKFFDYLLKETGLYEVDGIGASVIKKEDNLFRSRFVIHHSPGMKTGLIWKIFGDKPHRFSTVDLLPETTVFAGLSNLNFLLIKNWVLDLAKSSGIKKFSNGAETIEPNLKKAGIDLNEILKSIDGFSGLVITMDKSNMKDLTQGEKKITIPDPGIALILKVRNNHIFKLISKLSPGFEKSEFQNGEILTVKGTPPLPITVKPVIVQSKNYLIIGSNRKIADDLLASPNGKNKLINKNEFKELTRGIPQKGNSLTFMSKDFLRIITKINKISSSGKDVALKFLKNIGISLDNISVLKVMSVYDSGIIITSNSSLQPEAAFLVPAVMSAGIISAIVIPKILKAKKGRMSSLSSPQPSLTH